MNGTDALRDSWVIGAWRFRFFARGVLHAEFHLLILAVAIGGEACVFPAWFVVVAG